MVLGCLHVLLVVECCCLRFGTCGYDFGVVCYCWLLFVLWCFVVCVVMIVFVGL